MGCVPTESALHGRSSRVEAEEKIEEFLVALENAFLWSSSRGKDGSCPHRAVIHFQRLYVWEAARAK